MQILIENGVIVATASVGGYNGGVEFYGELPGDFAPYRYLWKAAEPVLSVDGEEITSEGCFIIRTEKELVKETDIDGQEHITEKISKIREYGEFVPNPDYVPPVFVSEPTNGELAAAISELAEVIFNG